MDREKDKGRETLSPREAAQRLGTSLYFIYHELWASRIPGAVKVGKAWRIPIESVRSHSKRRERHNG